LIYHPDKQGEGASDEAFKAVQQAYEILSDINKRRAFDSNDQVDDSIPSPTAQGDFFELFRPVFARNARYCNNVKFNYY